MIMKAGKIVLIALAGFVVGIYIHEKPNIITVEYHEDCLLMGEEIKGLTLGMMERLVD